MLTRFCATTLILLGSLANAQIERALPSSKPNLTISLHELTSRNYGEHKIQFSVSLVSAIGEYKIGSFRQILNNSADVNNFYLGQEEIIFDAKVSDIDALAKAHPHEEPYVIRVTASRSDKILFPTIGSGDIPYPIRQKDYHQNILWPAHGYNASFYNPNSFVLLGDYRLLKIEDQNQQLSLVFGARVGEPMPAPLNEEETDADYPSTW